MEYFIRSFIAAAIGGAIGITIKLLNDRQRRSDQSADAGSGPLTAVGDRYDPMPPTLEYVNALLSMNIPNTIEFAKAPGWAACWLSEGKNGQDLRQLAELAGDDPTAAQTTTRSALDELGVVAIGDEQAGRIIFDTWAQACLDGDLDELKLALDVQHLSVGCGYAAWLTEQPLGQTLGVDDERIGGHGRTEVELRAAVVAACQDQIASREPHT